MVSRNDKASENTEEKAALFEKVRSGDLDALRLFIKKFEREVFELCYALLGDPVKARQAAQDAFIKFYDARHRVHHPGPYLLRIARNLCYDEIENGTKTVEASGKNDKKGIGIIDTLKNNHNPLEILLEIQQDVEEEELWEKRKIQMSKAMKKLSKEYKEIIVIIHYQGKSYKEAARILQIPLGTVKSRLNRAIVKLGKILMEGS